MKYFRGKGNYIDKLRIYLKGGYGGAGFPKYGGIGGKGGDIYVKAHEGGALQQILKSEPSKRYIASCGGNSKQFVLVGKSGTDITIKAPLGTVCSTDSGVMLGEVNSHDDSILVCSGGMGGSPTNGFMGQKGEIHHVNLILKTIADVGLVGFPNAGKSTLLRMISRAKPKVASYPFTTLRPYLGQLEYPDARKISMADLPGLIEGASVNRGLGHSFLRHIERTRMMLIVVDVDGFRLNARSPHRSPMENILLLNKELELYDATLLNKPAMLIVNKMDLPGAEDKYQQLLEQINGGKDTILKYPDYMQPSQPLQLHEVIAVSAKTNVNSINYLKERIRKLLDIVDELKPHEDESSLTVTGDAHVFSSNHADYS